MPPRPLRFRLPILLLLIVFMLAGCIDEEPPATSNQPASRPNQSSASTKPGTAPAKPAANSPKTKWLIMLYEDADDEILEEDMYNDLNEAELVGSSDDVTIIAQMDRYDGGFDGDGDWTDARRYLVQQDDDLDRLHSKKLADLGEIDMADPNTLIDFVTWAANSYPAEHYALIMSDHGAGWPGGWSDSDSAGDKTRSKSPLAESFGDMIFLNELDGALKTIMNNTNIGKLDLIGFDACLMSSLEVYTAVAPYARYAVASQEVEPTLGWAYAAFLRSLVDKPTSDGAALAKAIVGSYIEQDEQIIDEKARAKYLERNYDRGTRASAKELADEEMRSVTLTAIDLSKIEKLNSSLDAFVTAVAPGNQKSVAAARRYAQSFETVFDEEQPTPYIDLGNFAQLVEKKISDDTIQQANNDLQAAIKQAVIKEKHGEDKPGATGISIHFPNSALYKDGDASAKSYTTVANAFAKRSLWDDFLAFHYTKKKLPKPSEAPAAADIVPATVDAPGASKLTLDQLQLSGSETSIQNPLAMKSSVSGENLAFVYVYIGRLDKKTNQIQILDMDFLDTDATKQVNGVYYPDWGSGKTVDVTYEWDARVLAIDDGSNKAIALIAPNDFGASAEQARYSVDGTYKTAKGKTSRRAQLIFSHGELVQVLGYTGKEGSGALREITPRQGDTFTINERWIPNTDAGAVIEPISKPGETITFGEDTLVWDAVAAPRGTYLVGFIAEDLDGNQYETHATVTRK